MNWYKRILYFPQILILVSALAVIIAITVLYIYHTPHSVTINHYGQKECEVSTKADNVNELLKEQEIELSAGDEVMPPLFYPLRNGVEVEITKNFPIKEEIDGTGFPHATYAETLAEIKGFDAPRIVFGPASWYGIAFHGRRTASGEVYDMYEHTAAHRELPLGIEVKVTFPETDESTIVNITDRGPYVGDRIIDLSRSAAEDLGLKPYGVEDVRLEVIPASNR